LKKLIFILVIALTLAGFWVAEPFGNNPFHTLAPPRVSVSGEYHCSSSPAGVKDQLHDLLMQQMSAGEFLGVSGAILKNKCGIIIASSGYRDKRNLADFSGSTISRIASITKPMTAIAIMQLHEAGDLDLNDPVQAYIPEFPQTGQVTTIRHLLSHTAGIPHYKSALDAMSFTRYESLESATEAILARGLVSVAGEKYVYSSFGYTLLGRIVEIASNSQFDRYLRENIWQKAGMKNTSLESSELPENKSRLYVKAGKFYLRSPHTDLSIIYPAGGVQSTAEDLLKFGQAILDNTLVSHETLELMLDVSESLAPAAGDDPYGLGWTVLESAEHGRIISHGGAQPGVSAQFQIMLDEGVVSAVMSNAYGTKRSAFALATGMGHLLL
jgi:CubicO group peptidase (beta-lactamase class C family)